LKAINLLEHLPETVRVIEEIHRVCADGAKVVIRVPYWNSPDMITDPTHRVFFNQFSLDYFDESRVYCQRRPYYSKARFHIDSIGYYIRFFRYWLIKNALLKMPLSFLSRYLGGIIWVLEFEMTAEKK
ncbi:MAG: hypothetical protein OEZ59_03265, partial [Deltaproteobacteria bacterium]|nr:hypothetical protein [Deltaproteobacteria bacterium]